MAVFKIIHILWVNRRLGTEEENICKHEDGTRIYQHGNIQRKKY